VKRGFFRIEVEKLDVEYEAMVDVLDLKIRNLKARSTKQIRMTKTQMVRKQKF
jgi:hypothetical protein